MTLGGLPIFPTSTTGAVGVWAAALALLGLLIKMRPIMKKLEHDRITQLENRFDMMTAQYAAERELHAAEMALVRHRLNGESATLDALAMMLESNSAIPPETIRRITESRIAAAKMFSDEMASITETRIQLAAAMVPPPAKPD